MKPLFSFDTSFLSNSRYIFSWLAIEVDLPTRKFVKQLCEAKSFNTVQNSSRQQKLKYLSQCEQINWTLIKNLLASANENGSTSRIASADKAFQVKCFTEELPTIVKLQRRRPDLYTPEWQCCSCGNTDKTYSHVWLCPNRRQELLECIQLTQETLYRHRRVHRYHCI